MCESKSKVQAAKAPLFSGHAVQDGSSSWQQSNNFGEQWSPTPPIPRCTWPPHRLPAPRSEVLERMRLMERRYAALVAASGFKGSTITLDTVALDTVLSLLFTACDRVRLRLGLRLAALAAGGCCWGGAQAA